MQVQPYLFFDGRAEEAIDFYKKAVGAEVGMLMRWKDSPEKSMCTPNNENKVMHASLTIGNTRVMASDGENKGRPDFKGFALSLDAKDEADADRPAHGDRELLRAIGVDRTELALDDQVREPMHE